MPKDTCKYFSSCGFFKKHSSELERENTKTIFHQYIKVYCFGSLRQDCSRYIQIEKTGVSLHEDITPTGIKYNLDEEER